MYFIAYCSTCANVHIDNSISMYYEHSPQKWFTNTWNKVHLVTHIWLLRCRWCPSQSETWWSFSGDRPAMIKQTYQQQMASCTKLHYCSSFNYELSSSLDNRPAPPKVVLKWCNALVTALATTDLWNLTLYVLYVNMTSSIIILKPYNEWSYFYVTDSPWTAVSLLQSAYSTRRANSTDKIKAEN